MHRSALVMVLALVAGSMYVPSAQAYDGLLGYGFPWFGYGNNGPAAYALGNIPAPPYFALHPPVYYSRPVPRTYGYSPFAAPGYYCQQDIRPATRVVLNPYIPAKPSASDNKRAAGVAVAPQRIANPYFQPAKELAAN